MKNVPFSQGLKRHAPVFLQQVEQVFGIAPNSFAQTLPAFGNLTDLSVFEQVLITSPVIHMVQPQLRVLFTPDNTAVTGMELVVTLMGMRFMSLIVLEDEGYMLRGHGFCLHSADASKVMLNPEALVEVYMDEPFVRLRMLLERAVNAFPVAALTEARSVQADILTLLAQYAQALAMSMQQMRGTMLRACTVSPELMADMPAFLALIDTALGVVGYDLRPSLAQRWEARVASVGAENIRANDVEALFRIPQVPLMMSFGIDEDKRELHYVWVPLTLSNKSVIHVEVGGKRGRASLVFDFATLVVGAEGASPCVFDPQAFRKFENTLTDAATRQHYRQLILSMLRAFAPLASCDAAAESARRRALLFINSPQMEGQASSERPFAL
jgi:hypothetical protein